LDVILLNTNRLIEIDKTNSENPESIQSKKTLGKTGDESCLDGGGWF
jgi:hypothetical protein